MTDRSTLRRLPALGLVVGLLVFALGSVIHTHAAGPPHGGPAIGEPASTRYDPSQPRPIRFQIPPALTASSTSSSAPALTTNARRAKMNNNTATGASKTLRRRATRRSRGHRWSRPRCTRTARPTKTGG